jgi:hypothetical protein
VLGAVLALAATACDAASSTNGHAAGDPPAYILADSPLVSIGGQDHRPEYQLQYPVGAVRLADGRLAIADAGFRNLLYYDRNGEHLRTSGRTGQGPGEFRNLRSLARIRGDTLVVWDAGPRRASFFDSTGAFARGSGPYRLGSGSGESPLSFHAVHLTRTGRVVVEPWAQHNPASFDDPTVIQDTVPLYSFDGTGEHSQALGPFPSVEFFFNRRSGTVKRFGDMLHVAPADDFVWVGSGRKRVIRAIALNGDTLNTIALPFGRRAVLPEDVPPPRTERAMLSMNAMPVPDSMPVFSELRVGADDRLWVQKYRAPLDVSQEWLAIGEAGDVLASLSMDASLELLDIGPDYVLVLTEDDLDVPAVRMYQLRVADPETSS